MKNLFKAQRLNDKKWVYGSLWNNKIFVDFKKNEKYYLIFDIDWDLKAQINYLTNPEEFSHLSESVHKVIPETIKYIA